MTKNPIQQLTSAARAVISNWENSGPSVTAAVDDLRAALNAVETPSKLRGVHEVNGDIAIIVNATDAERLLLIAEDHTEMLAAVVRQPMAHDSDKTMHAFTKDLAHELRAAGVTVDDDAVEEDDTV